MGLPSDEVHAMTMWAFCALKHLLVRLERLTQICDFGEDVSMGPVWGPAAVGAILGAAYAALNRMGMKRIWRAPHAPLNVVVTGGTKGLGKAMAREFLRCSLTFLDAASAMTYMLDHCT